MKTNRRNHQARSVAHSSFTLPTLALVGSFAALVAACGSDAGPDRLSEGKGKVLVGDEGGGSGLQGPRPGLGDTCSPEDSSFPCQGTLQCVVTMAEYGTGFGKCQLAEFPYVQGVGDRCGGQLQTTQCRAGLECSDQSRGQSGIQGFCFDPAGNANPPPPAAEAISCAGWNPATYCGGNYVAGDPGTLYHCDGSVLHVIEVCANGCHAFKGPEDDRCY